MQMKQRHRAVQQPFDPGRNTLFLAALQQSGFPMMQQENPGWNRVEQSALRDKQCQRNRLPCDVGMIILQRQRLKKEKPCQAAIEQESGDAKRTIEQIQRAQRKKGTEQTNQDDSELRFDTDQLQLGIEQVQTDRVTQFVERKYRVFRPEMRAGRQIINVRQVKADISEVVWGNHSDPVVHDENDLTKFSDREDQEERAERESKVSVLFRWADQRFSFPEVQRERRYEGTNEQCSGGS